MRTPDSVRAAQGARDKAWNWASVRGLPPGYIEGFKMDSYRGKPRFTDGICSVMGLPVEVQESHVISAGKYERTKVAERRHYCYLDREGTFLVDLVKPVYRGNQHAKYHPSAGYRFLGFFFLDCDKNLIFCRGQDVTDVSDIIIARDDFEGYEDFRCSGDADHYIDHEYFQDAVDYASAIGGGRIKVIAGKYYFGAALEMKSNVTLTGDNAGGSIIQKNCNDYAIEAVGVSGTEIENIGIENLTVTRDSGDTNAKALVLFDYCIGLTIQDCLFLNSYDTSIDGDDSKQVLIIDNRFEDWEHYGIDFLRVRCTISENFLQSDSSERTLFERQAVRLMDCDGSIVSSNHIYDINQDGNVIGIYLFGSADLHVVDNQLDNLHGTKATATSSVNGGIIMDGDPHNSRIINNRIKDVASYGISSFNRAISIDTGIKNTQVKSNTCIDNGNLIDRGNCESATPPMIFGETVPALFNTLFVRSNGTTDPAYEGTYSWKQTKNIAAGMGSRASLTDNENAADMHGMVAGLTYTHYDRVYIPSTGGPLAAEVSLYIVEYYAGGWHFTPLDAAATQDAWELLTGTFTLNAGTVGFYIYVAITWAAQDGEYIFRDNIRLQPIGVTNDHDQHYSDAGTLTYAATNSWQRP